MLIEIQTPSRIHLKLDNTQPSGSFKSRGVGNFMRRAVESCAEGPNSVHFFCSSGGNAGLACITAANTFGLAATIVVPLSTLPHMVAKLRDLGAEVIQVGANWAMADNHLRQVCMPEFERTHPGAKAVYVPPFDHQDVWNGSETLVDELRVQMGEENKVDGIALCVGGGGLLCGVMQGVQKLEQSGYGTPKVLAVEAYGGESLNASIRAGKLVTLPGITTISTSLGAVRVAEEAFAWTQRAGENLVSAVVTDKESVEAIARFLDDARILVESACGVTISTVYNGKLKKYLGAGLSDEEWAAKNIVIVVCGGSNISLGMLEKYKEQFGIS